MTNVKIVLVGLKRRGQWVLVYETAEGSATVLRPAGCTVIRSAPGLWRARKRLERELGGSMGRHDRAFPLPHGGRL